MKKGASWKNEVQTTHTISDKQPDEEDYCGCSHYGCAAVHYAPFNLLVPFCGISALWCCVLSTLWCLLLAMLGGGFLESCMSQCCSSSTEHDMVRGNIRCLWSFLVAFLDRLFIVHITVGIIHTIIHTIIHILFFCILGAILISRVIVFIIVLVRRISFRILLVIIVVTIIFFVPDCSI